MSDDFQSQSRQKKKHKLRKRKQLFLFHKSEFFKTPISFVSQKIYKLCGNHQFAIFITVFFLFLVFVGFVVYKNFFGSTDIVIELYKGQIVAAHINTDGFSKFVLTLVEIATLPILILTLMFSAHGGFKNSQREDSVDNKFGYLNEEIRHNNDDIRHNNEDINRINENINHIKEDIVAEINKRIPSANLSEEIDIEIETQTINEDKIGGINPDK